MGLNIQLNVVDDLKQHADYSDTNMQGNTYVIASYPQSELNNYATFENNFWRLDGNYTIAGYLPTYLLAMFSAEVSDSNCAFYENPYYTVEFYDDVYSIYKGITLQMTDEYCTDVKIVYYDSSDVVIKTTEITANTNADLFIPDEVDNVSKIKFEFVKTKSPHHFAKLINIEYGQLVKFEDDVIIEAYSIDEVDLLATSLPVGQLDFSVLSTDDRFNILNPSGVYDNLRENLPVLLFYSSAGASKQIGRYYLSGWKEISENVYSFSAVNTIGYFKTKDYIGSGILNAKTMQMLAQDIFEGSPVSLLPPYFYYIDDSLKSYTFYNYLPRMDCASALQNALICCGGFMWVDQLGVPHFSVPFQADDESITIHYEDMMGPPKIEQTALIDGYEISFNLINISDLTGFYYALNTVLWSNTTKGLLDFSKGDLYGVTHPDFYADSIYSEAAQGAPEYSVAAFDRDIGSSNISIEWTTSGSETVLYCVGHNITVIESSAAALTAQKGKTTKLSGNTLISSMIEANDTGQRLLDYYSKSRLKTTFKHEYHADVYAGKFIYFTDKFGNTIGGNITKLKTDLTGGMLQEIEVSGSVI